MPFQTILCPIDFSDCSRVAMSTAINLAKESGASITLLHVWEVPVTSAEMPILPNLYEKARADAARSLAEWRARGESQAGRELGTVLVEGTPWERIVALLNDDTRYDLVVMGTHGRVGLEHILLGSVAEKVLRHAPCPVLVIRSR